MTDIEIDESFHEEVPSLFDRLKSALVAMALGFALFQLIGFWMFPGLGFHFTLVPLSGWEPFNYLSSFVNIMAVTFLALCGVFGWFGGTYVTDRLKGYFNFWKFW